MAEKPVVAAVLLALVVAAAWFFMRGGADDTSARPAASSFSQSATDGGAASADLGSDPDSGLPYIAESQLPGKAHEVLADIRAGGPYEFEEDDDVFGNYEGILPQQPGGYYREYTVKLPTDSTRGAHRLVTGEDGEIYWTEDHYESFSVVKEGT